MLTRLIEHHKRWKLSPRRTAHRSQSSLRAAIESISSSHSLPTTTWDCKALLFQVQFAACLLSTPHSHVDSWSFVHGSAHARGLAERQRIRTRARSLNDHGSTWSQQSLSGYSPVDTCHWRRTNTAPTSYWYVAVIYLHRVTYCAQSLANCERRECKSHSHSNHPQLKRDCCCTICSWTKARQRQK